MTDFPRLSRMERDLNQMLHAERDPQMRALLSDAMNAVARAAFGPVQAVGYAPPPTDLPFNPKET